MIDLYKIVEKERLNDLVEKMVIEAPYVVKKCEPGQFVMIIVDEGGERIPLTIADYNREKKTVTIIYQMVGYSTKLLGTKKEGEYISDIAGPLGMPSLFEGKKRILGIAGGVGAAPLFPQLKKANKNGAKTDLILGARSADYVILEDEFSEFCTNRYIVTDDGTKGKKGFVTTALQKLIDDGENYDEVIAIGPLPMMNAVVKITKKYNISTSVSLNPIMIDGTGMCGGCRVTVGGETKFACVDGPDFNGLEVDFEELMEKQGIFKEEEENHNCKLEKKIQRFNMEKEKTKMRELDPKERVKSFDEVSLGYSLEEALTESARCVQCKHPACIEACPVSVNIPGFIQKLRDKDLDGAYKTLSKENSLPAICGRVCPQEKQCESACVRGKKGEAVAIGRLERFVGDYALESGLTVGDSENKKSEKIAVIGSGPAGLGCAGELINLGYEVTMFEALHETGGVLRYGIPEFRLPKSIVDKEIENLKNSGLRIEKNVVVGKSIEISELKEEGFEAVFIGSGAGLPRFMGIPGENLNGVYSSNEFLTRINLMKAYREDSPTPVKLGKKVAVIGGGNVAMDAARIVARLGVDNVYIIYRRGMEELPARNEEIEHAIEEGVEFKTLCNPSRIIGEKGKVKGIECVEMELGEEDSSGRRRPQEIEGSEFILDLDSVIIAIGQTPNPLLKQSNPDLDTNSHGGIIVEKNSMETNIEDVYAGGDVVTGAATVILAMGAGKKAARAIDTKIKNR